MQTRSHGGIAPWLGPSTETAEPRLPRSAAALPPPGCCPNGPHLRKWLDEAVELVLDIRDPFSNPRRGQETVQIGVREIGWGLQNPRKDCIEDVRPAAGGCPNTVGPAVAVGDSPTSHKDGLLEILSRVVHS